MKAVIFDMDGVIIDSEPIHNVTLLDTFAKYNVKFDPADFPKFVGLTTPFILQKLIDEQQLPITLTEILTYHETNLFAAIRDGDLTAIDGIPELLATLREKNIPAAIASSSPLCLIKTVVAKFGLQDFFVHLTSGEDLPKSKPDPAIYRITAEKLGVDPADCLVIEDAKLGVQAAKAAGMTCIGFQNINSGDQDLSKADRIVHSIREISV